MEEGEMQAIGVPALSTITSVSVGNRGHRAFGVAVYDETGQMLGQVKGAASYDAVNVVLDHPVSGPATLVVAMLTQPAAAPSVLIEGGSNANPTIRMAKLGADDDEDERSTVG